MCVHDKMKILFCIIKFNVNTGNTTKLGYQMFHVCKIYPNV